MDTYEATRVVLTRIQNLDPENASKIMGVLLLQDHGEKEMIRLAFGPESLLHSVVLKARKELGLISGPLSPNSPNSASTPNNLSRQNSGLGPVPPRLLPSPLSIPSPTHWSPGFPDFDSPVSPGPNNLDLFDEFQIQDQLSFLNDGCSGSPGLGGPKSPYSYNDLANSSSWGSDESTCGFGWKPCLYYARGYCKNGSSCRFLHVGGGDVAGGDVEGVHEVMRSKRLAAAMAASGFPYSGSGLGLGLGGNKCLSLLLQQQQSERAAALMMGDDYKLGRSRLERADFSMSPGSRQIYLTFPADSTFREEDVSNYFSNFGPVQDVRIPYQQKRMFGFVTFVYPETVKLILAKGNPHFVCDARVLVKPYKEKGKIPDKFRKQQLERGEFGCGSPTGLDSRADPFDLPLGPRMFGNGNGHDILWRRKLEEQAELQQALELQGRRLMSLQLLDVKRHNHHHHHHRSLSSGTAIPSPTHSSSFFNQSLVLTSDRSSPDSVIENGFHLSSPAMTVSTAAVFTDHESKETVNVMNENEKEKDVDSEKGSPTANGILSINGNVKDTSPQDDEESDLPESLDHNLNLPDSPFASPKATAGDFTVFNSSSEAEKIGSAPGLGSGLVSSPSSANKSLIASALLPASSTLDIAPFNSCYFQVPRFSSGHGAIEM